MDSNSTVKKIVDDHFVLLLIGIISGFYYILIDDMYSLSFIIVLIYLIILYRTRPIKQGFMDKVRNEVNQNESFIFDMILNGILTAANLTNHIEYEDFMFFSRIKLNLANSKPIYIWNFI